MASCAQVRPNLTQVIYSKPDTRILFLAINLSQLVQIFQSRSLSMEL